MLWMPISLGIILGADVNRKKKWKSLLILFVIMYLVSLVIGDERGMILIMFAEAFILRWWLKCPWMKLIYIPISYVEIMVCNLVAEVIAVNVPSLTVKELATVSPYREFYAFAILLLIVLVSYFVRAILKMFYGRVFSISKEVIVLIFSDAILCMIVFMVNSWINKKVMLPEVNRIINISMILYVVFTFTVSIIIFKS